MAWLPMDKIHRWWKMLITWISQLEKCLETNLQNWNESMPKNYIYKNSTERYPTNGPEGPNYNNLRQIVRQIQTAPNPQRGQQLLLLASGNTKSISAIRNRGEGRGSGCYNAFKTCVPKVKRLSINFCNLNATSILHDLARLLLILF
jgi:hypothetical protein